jgi:UPF0755 protein
MKLLKIIALLLLILVIGTVGGSALWFYNFVSTAKVHDKTAQYIQIARGSTPGDITNKLAAEGIISNSIAMQIYLRVMGENANLKAGEYKFNSPITPAQVVEELKKGEERTSKLTIPEGWSRFDIAKAIFEKYPQEPATDEKAILALMDDVSLIKEFDPTAKNLEGYLFPSTYNFPQGTSPKQMIKGMVDQFKKVWKPEWNAQAQALGRTPKEIVTIASLIETEAKREEERPLVASVVYNRVKKGIPLGIDATNIYIAKMNGKWDGIIHKSDLEIDSPYNSRKVVGLPPGPISSPSESALKAALNPAQTDYIYYVLDPAKTDGTQNFYASAADFERAKIIYQKWLVEQQAIRRQQEAANNTNN